MTHILALTLHSVARKIRIDAFTTVYADANGCAVLLETSRGNIDRALDDACEALDALLVVGGSCTIGSFTYLEVDSDDALSVVA